MPAYSFEALDLEGRSSRGVIDADNDRAARALLRTRGLIPMGVAAVDAGGKEKSKSPSLFRSSVLSNAALAIWTRQLAGLIEAGLPLERTLTALADEAEDPKLQGLFAALRAEVNAGSSFARALAQHPGEFPEIYIAVVGAGEQSGALGQVLERLATDLEEGQALKAKIVGAALYPVIVGCIAFAIVMFLVTYVVPQVANVFAGSKRTLPWLTVAMLSISAAVRNQGLWVLLLAAFAAVAGRQALLRDSLRERFDAVWLRLPLIGRLSRDYNAARFGSTLAMLASAGVPILKALQAAAETLNNRAMRADALDALVLVREGAPLASAIAGKKRFPGLLVMFARQGEQTGTLPAMLQRAARQLSAEVQRRALQMATLLEPLMIVFMGAAVLLIVLAVLLPIIQLNQLVK